MIKNHPAAGYGGGMAVLVTGYAKNNTVSLLQTNFLNNTAEFGGGLGILLDEFSRDNVISSYQVFIAFNKAYAGGGTQIKFHHSTKGNTVYSNHTWLRNNELLLQGNSNAMGGGVNIVFDTNKATYVTRNVVKINRIIFTDNNAKDGIGGGFSLFYVHSPQIRESGDLLYLGEAVFMNNLAMNGQAISLQSSPKYQKALFKDITLNETMFCSFRNATPIKEMQHRYHNPDAFGRYLHETTEELVTAYMPGLMKQINPILQVQINTSMVLLVSIKVRIENRFVCSCGGISQGILAIDSELTLQPIAEVAIQYCVATHGGGVALYGESYIRFPYFAQMFLIHNFAFQRGGALYVDSTHSASSNSHCFLQNDKGRENSHSKLYNGIVLVENMANHEGKSVFISNTQSCLSNVMIQIIFADIEYSCFIQSMADSTVCAYTLHSFEENKNGTKFRKCYDRPFLNSNCSESEEFFQVHQEIMFQPNHIDGTSDHLTTITVQFIPGIQKQLPFAHAYDRLGNVINTVFTAQIISEEVPATVQLNPFSKYTADFTVIVHGIPLQHGMFFRFNASNTSGTMPLLVLQSVDNKYLQVAMFVELQCCPPGYTLQNSSKDKGSCHCGMPRVLGIVECNESDPNNIGAVLKGYYWAGYLPSDDQHSCEGQKFFSAPCPPGYCQTQQTTLPNNNSKQILEDAVCKGSKRKGLLCGDCLEGSSIAVNFNGMRPVCTSCQDGLSTVGLLVWILSEWMPMLVVMFIVMLFNIDLVSGRFNSFLLFAQLLAFSSIRGDAELGTVHIAFVKIYRFLYGMWNLDFFGVLLPPYCLIPHSHLTLLQTLLLHYSIGLFPLIVAITLIVLERSAEKWICCHRVDQCLRRMRRWKAKYSDGMSYDRALPAFVILGFTRFLVSSSYILVNQTITGEDGEERMVVWWQGSVPYGSIQHIAYFIPAIIILLVFVLLPAFLLLTLPIVPQLFGRLIVAVPPLRKLQRMQTFCSNVYTDRWIYHFVNVFQGCYKERYRSFSSLYLFYRIIHLLASVFIPRTEVALCIQLILTLLLLQLIVIFQPYTVSHLNILDTAVLGNMSLILVLSLLMNISETPFQAKQFFASVRMIFIFLPLLYPAILCGRKVYMKCANFRCCQKKKENDGGDVEPLLVDPTEGLGNFIQITELRAGAPTSSDEESETETQKRHF